MQGLRVGPRLALAAGPFLAIDRRIENDISSAAKPVLLAAKLVGFGISFVLPLMIVRFLTQENVGLYRESFQVITNALIILPLGFSMSAYYFLARETDERRVRPVR